MTTSQGNRPTSGWDPMTSTPAITLLTAKAATASKEKPSAVSTFPANTSARLQERVSTVVQVP